MVSPSNRSRRLGLVLETWNRKLHFYLGLYFLFFLWLFSFTGLLLNHPRWTISRIPNDPNPVFERTIESPRGAMDVERANDVIRQLGLRGELELPQTSPPPATLEFNLA